MAQITVNVPDHPQAHQGGAAPHPQHAINWQHLFDQLAPVLIQAIMGALGGGGQNPTGQTQAQQQAAAQGQQPQKGK